MQSDSANENYINRNFIIVGLETLFQVRKVFDPLSIFIFIFLYFFFFVFILFFIYNLFIFITIIFLEV